MLPDGTGVVSALGDPTSAERITYRLLGGALDRAWKLSRWIERGRHARVEARAGECPTFACPIPRAGAVARRALALRPRFVFGMEVFQYGLATALCRGVPRILMPWGGDIYLYAEASAVSFNMVRRALSRVDLLCPSAKTAASHLAVRFGIPASRIRTISWGVDRPRFRRADTGRREETFARFGIDPSRRLFLNVRRFLPIWGCDVALEVFRRYARVDPAAHFVMLGGIGTEGMVREAREALRADGLEGRFTLFEGDTAFDDCIDLMAVADVFLSLMRVPDMRSASIVQASYAGGIPVLSDQPEYREMERDGFRALFVDPVDTDGIVAALRECVGKPWLAEEIRAANERYIDEHEDHEVQMVRLREAIEEVCGKYGV